MRERDRGEGRWLFAALVAALLLFAALPARADRVMAVLDEINALRRQHGLPAVRLEPRLAGEARHQAADMARHGYLDTRTPSGDGFATRLDEAGYFYRRVYVGVAAGFPGPVGVVAGWTAADETRKYLLDPAFTDIGLAYAAHGAEAARLDHFWVLTLAEPSRPAGGDWRAAVLEGVNAFRVGRGLPPLRVDRRLEAAAQAHAEDMARRDYFAHVTPEGTTPGARASRAGYPWRRVGENIASGQTTPDETVEVWKASPRHRDAMLDPELRDAGIGYAFLPQDDGRIRTRHYWALAMGRRR